MAVKYPGNLSQLARDYCEDFDRIKPFYAHDYRNRQALWDAIAKRQAVPYSATELAAVLREQNQSFGCGEKTFAGIEKLVGGKAFAVVTGQQVGLFGGPLFTIYKALTVVKLAEQWARETGEAIVPVFWLVSEDHDFAEVASVAVVDLANQVRAVSYPAANRPQRQPVWRLRLEEAIEETFRRLTDELTPDTEFKSEVMEVLRRCYRVDNGLAQAFAEWMAYLFRDFGVILVDPADVRLKRLAAEVFRREIEAESPSTQAVLAVGKKLRASGYHEQIKNHPGHLNLFLVNEERETLVERKGSFFVKASGEKFSKEELLAFLDAHPGRFSPNVVLRPIYQDTLLPTIAYVGGPGEIAYFAQLRGVYEAFGIPMPIVYPRKSLTIVEKRIARYLKKYYLSVEEIWANPEGVFQTALHRQMGGDLQARVAEVARRMDKEWRSLAEEVATFDPTLRAPMDKAGGKIQQQIKMAEKKILQAYKKHNEVLHQHMQSVVNHLYPNGVLQERQLNLVPYLIRYGWNFVRELYVAIDLSHYEHQLYFVP